MIPYEIKKRQESSKCRVVWGLLAELNIWGIIIEYRICYRWFRGAVGVWLEMEFVSLFGLGAWVVDALSSYGVVGDL